MAQTGSAVQPQSASAPASALTSLTVCGEGSSVDDARPFGSIDESGRILMLRKLLMTAGAGALVAMAIGGASFASASGGGEGGGRTIVVIEKTTSQKFLDLGKPGPTAGDEFFFASQFWNTARTHKVGSNRGFCTFETQTAAHCVGTAQLAGGRSSSQARRRSPALIASSRSPVGPARSTALKDTSASTTSTPKGRCLATPSSWSDKHRTDTNPGLA